MRERIKKALGECTARGRGFEYLVDAIEMYDDGATLKDIYSKIADKYGVGVNSVEKSVARVVSESFVESSFTPKAFIARIKERIMFELGE